MMCELRIWIEGLGKSQNESWKDSVAWNSMTPEECAVSGEGLLESPDVELSRKENLMATEF